MFMQFLRYQFYRLYLLFTQIVRYFCQFVFKIFLYWFIMWLIVFLISLFACIWRRGKVILIYDVLYKFNPSIFLFNRRYKKNKIFGGKIVKAMHSFNEYLP